MKSNSNLHAAKRAKQDEFYTQRSDIEKEMSKYPRDYFRGKVVYCNCDDPLESNFFKHFAMSFNILGLKRLIATGYEGSPQSKGRPKVYELKSLRDVNRDGAEDWQDVLRQVKKTRLRGDGDFRSPESLALLAQADVVVTNPPFSLFREYIAQLVEHDKKFLVIGSLNAITYKEVFPLIRDNKLWLGVMHPKEFRVPDGYTGASYVNEDGHKIAKFGNILWYTNLAHSRRSKRLGLYRRYSAKDYPRYDNYPDVINVDKVKEIPEDYPGEMGVPITYLEHHNPEQFDILGLANDVRSIGVDLRTVVGGKHVYNRIVIRRKKA